MVMGLVILYPLFNSILMSFQSVNLGYLAHSTFVGFSNYYYVLSGHEFYSSLIATTIFTGISVAGSFVCALALALLVNREIVGARIVKGLLIIPWAIPWFVSYIEWGFLYTPIFGQLDYLLHILLGPLSNIAWSNIAWLSDPSIAIYSVCIAVIWTSTPFALMFLLAGLQTIPLERYESAKMDGAGMLASFWYVTLPSLRKIIVIVVTFLVIFLWESFTPIFVMTRGGPAGSTSILYFEVWRQAFLYYDFGDAAATGVLALLVVFTFSVLYSREALKEE
jgi:ABC-type sugar transport system permease subunit